MMNLRKRISKDQGIDYENEQCKKISLSKSKRQKKENLKVLTNNSAGRLSKEEKDLKTKVPTAFDKPQSMKSKTVQRNKKTSVIKSEVMPNNLEILKTEAATSKTENVPKSLPSKTSKKMKDEPVIPPLKYEFLGEGPPPIPPTGKKYMGCHVSAAGGVWKCFEYGEMSGANSIALFLRSQRSWNAKPLDQKSVENWKAAIKSFPPHLILPHGSYLMNLGSPKDDVLEKSRLLLVEELQRCDSLGIPHFNFHPGSSLGQITREECCRRVAESINAAHRHTSKVICVIENMSRQGFTVGGDLHEIRLIIEGVEDKTRVGVCIDTCHAHAAGYDLATEEGFNRLVSDFERIIGWQFLRGLHINDSKGKAGDHLDRHENIGKGTIEKEGFRRIMKFPRFNDLPLILETPFVSEEGYAKEIKMLQNMVK